MGIQAETSFSLKDQLFNKAKVQTLAAAIASVHPAFDAQGFTHHCVKQFPELELKARIVCLVEGLHRYLPSTFVDAQRILHDALPVPLDPTLSDDDFGEFIWVVPGEYVARYGCDNERLKTSLDFLQASTQRFSAEYAIRHFLLRFPDQTLAFLARCARHENYHVRRLASEGSRPALPWGLKVALPTQSVLGLLDQLYADPTRYVVRSVANSLNDISKFEPQAVLQALVRWRSEARQSEAELEWLINHALRTLVKQGNQQALEFLGYPAKPKIELHGSDCPAKVCVGETLLWQANITALRQQKLKIALRVAFLKANGSHSEKVFAVKDIAVAPGESVTLSKRIAFKPMTTRVLYPGQHHVTVVVNGKDTASHAFELAL